MLCFDEGGGARCGVFTSAGWCVTGRAAEGGDTGGGRYTDVAVGGQHHYFVEGGGGIATAKFMRRRRGEPIGEQARQNGSGDAINQSFTLQAHTRRPMAGREALA